MRSFPTLWCPVTRHKKVDFELAVADNANDLDVRKSACGMKENYILPQEEQTLIWHELELACIHGHVCVRPGLLH